MTDSEWSRKDSQLLYAQDTCMLKIRENDGIVCVWTWPFVVAITRARIGGRVSTSTDDTLQLKEQDCIH